MTVKRKAVPPIKADHLRKTASNPQSYYNSSPDNHQDWPINVPKLAHQLLNAGFEPIPIVPGQKYPTLKNWSKKTLPVPFAKNNNIGLRTGRVSAIDVDIYDPVIVKFITECMDFPHLERIGQTPKTLVPILCPEIKKKMLSDSYIDEHGIVNRIEVLSYGQQFVAYGIHPSHKTSISMVWCPSDPPSA